MSTYIDLPLTGASPYWGNAVASAAGLPASGPVNGAIVFVFDTESLYYWDQVGAAWIEILNGLADVRGPVSSTDNAFARFDGITGKIIQNSVVTATDLGNITTPGDLGAVNVAASSQLSGATAVIGALTGPLKGATGVVSASAINLASAEVTGTLPVGNGGTGSATALSNNRVMRSSGGLIVEATAITASRALASDADGIPVASATTAAELGFVNGVTSAIQTQINTKVTGPASATDLAVPVYDATTGKLIKNSGVTIDASDNVNTPARINAATALVGATGAAGTAVTLGVGGITGGFLLPQLTTAQRNALAPSGPIMVFDSTLARPLIFITPSWYPLVGWGEPVV